MEPWIMSLIVTLFCLVVAGNQYRQGDTIKTQATTAKRLDERITAEIAKIEERQVQDRNIITSRVDQISKDVVFTDVFSQHEKVDEANSKHNEKMFQLLERQLEGIVSSNTKEHSRLSEKLDEIPRMIREEIQNAVKAKG